MNFVGVRSGAPVEVVEERVDSERQVCSVCWDGRVVAESCFGDGVLWKDLDS